MSGPGGTLPGVPVSRSLAEKLHVFCLCQDPFNMGTHGSAPLLHVSGYSGEEGFASDEGNACAFGNPDRTFAFFIQKKKLSCRSPRPRRYARRLWTTFRKIMRLQPSGTRMPQHHTGGRPPPRYSCPPPQGSVIQQQTNESRLYIQAVSERPKHRDMKYS